METLNAQKVSVRVAMTKAAVAAVVDAAVAVTAVVIVVVSRMNRPHLMWTFQQRRLPLKFRWRQRQSLVAQQLSRAKARRQRLKVQVPFHGWLIRYRPWLHPHRLKRLPLLRRQLNPSVWNKCLCRFPSTMQCREKMPSSVPRAAANKRRRHKLLRASRWCSWKRMPTWRRPLLQPSWKRNPIVRHAAVARSTRNKRRCS